MENVSIYDRYPWLHWPTDANRDDCCSACRTSPAHVEEQRAVSQRYARAMDITINNSRPSPDLRAEMSALTLAVQRRQECERHHPDVPQEKPV